MDCFIIIILKDIKNYNYIVFMGFLAAHATTLTILCASEKIQRKINYNWILLSIMLMS
jgi:hypothetical protein